jgi:hypothetical protein
MGALMLTGRHATPVAIAAAPWLWGSGQQPHTSAA